MVSFVVLGGCFAPFFSITFFPFQAVNVVCRLCKPPTICAHDQIHVSVLILSLSLSLPLPLPTLYCTIPRHATTSFPLPPVIPHKCCDGYSQVSY